MALSIDVTLHADWEPRFPARCIRCGDSSAHDNFAVSDTAIPAPLLLILPFLSPLERRRFEIPCCRECGRLMRRARLIRQLITISVVCLAILVLVRFAPGIRASGGRLAMAGAVLLLITPYVCVAIFFAPVVDLVATRKQLVFQFADRRAAEEFHRLNEPAIIESEAFKS